MRRRLADILGWTGVALTLTVFLTTVSFVVMMIVGNIRCHVWSDDSRRYLPFTGCQVCVVKAQWRTGQ